MTSPLRRSRSALLAAALLLPAAVLVMTSGEAASAPRFPSIGSSGITFSASVPTDPQRDVGEPEIHIDNGGNIYTCGPSGFSNIADYAQVSTDGGDQFHLLGQAPRGQISAGEGGGDCGLASSPYPVEGHYPWAYTGLGPLTNFSTGTTSDTGRTITTSAISESPPGVDRQWMVFTDERTVFLNYNQLATGYTVQKSTDAGLTYGPAIITGAGGGRIGPMRAILSPDRDASKAIVYFPSYDSTRITIVLSMNGGTTWSNCNVLQAGMNPSAGFVIADHDSDGNVYIAWSEKGGKTGDNDTWMTAIPRANLSQCASAGTNGYIGTGRMHRVNRDSVETTVMPWLVAGDRGRVAVAYFGTDTVGDPDDGALVASWYPYVSMTLDALSANPRWSQAATTSHPFHYNSICLGGLGCDLSAGDRSLADYFAMDLDPKTGRLHIVYGSAAKKPTDAEGHVSTATVVSQETGPSLLGGTLKERRPRIRNTTSDPSGDALAPYSQLYAPAQRQNLAALDFRNVSVTGTSTEETVTFKLQDLSDSALQAALVGTQSQSVVWLWRFLNGYQPAGITAAWSPATGFTCGFDNFTTKSTESGQADPTAEKILVWNQTTKLACAVDQAAGTIKVTAPRSVFFALHGPTGRGQVPKSELARDGDLMADGTAFSMSNSVSPSQALQSYLYPVDSTPAMDAVVGKPRAAVVTPPKTGGKPPTTGGGGSGSTPPLATTGLNEVLPMVAVLLLAGAAVLVRGRRATR